MSTTAERTPKPSADDMRLAAEWLDVNEGEEGESQACCRVRDWLRAEADKRDLKVYTREAARKHGVPVSRVRAAIAKAERELLSLVRNLAVRQ